MDFESDDATLETGRLETLAPPKVALAPVMQDSINASLWENSVPVLGELSLLNESDRDLPLVEVNVRSEPSFIRPRSWRLGQVGAGQLRLIKDLDLPLDGALLVTQTEASRTRVTFTASDGTNTLAEVTRDVRILARNEWGGLSGIPDILAAFVLPNDPAVARILKVASETLRQAGQSPSLEGYQTDKARVWAQAQAIWCAVSALNISYISPPASFVEHGQRVRLPSQVLEERLATCLDLAVLFAACLEQAGLRPFIVLTQDHAFAGFWLSKLDAGSSVLHDLPAIRNLLKLDDLRVFEATMVTSARKPSFASACGKGENNLRAAANDGESDFREVIDVHRARLRRIRPLSTVGEVKVEADREDTVEAEQPVFEAPPELREDKEETEGPDNPADRIQRWCNRLLDMSARNRLLNLPKSDKQLIEIDCPDPATLEDMLSEMRAGERGKPLHFSPSPGLMNEDDLRRSELHWDRHGEDAARAYALEALGRRELLVWRKEDKLQDALTEIYRQARAAEQEGGTNVLYLTIGALAWTEQSKGKTYLAPLVLVPVILERASVKSAFTLRPHGDESRINATLLEMLRSDYSIRIPALDGAALPEDGSGLDVRHIIETFRLHLRHIPGWEIREHVSLTTLSFAKFLMWKDLLERRDSLRANDVAGRLLDGAAAPREPGPSRRVHGEAEDLDEALSRADLVCPLEADSSQLRAIARAASGESFVLIGPPGTGKSQTIANIVANTLAQGRTVLFVAEKRTALEVVRARLARLGVAEFCLDLFSPKADKMGVLEQFQAAQNVLASFGIGEYARAKRSLDAIRSELNAYVRDLHRCWRNGWTPYQGLGVMLRAERAGTVRIAFSDWHRADAHDEADYERLANAAENLAALYERIGDVVTSPRLAGLDHHDWSPLWESRLLDAVGVSLSSLAALRSAARDVAEKLRIGDEDVSLGRLSQVDSLCAQLLRAEIDSWAFGEDARQKRDEVHAEREHVERHGALTGALVGGWQAGVTALPLGELLREWRAARDRWLIARGRALKAVRQKLEPYASPLPDDCEPDLVRLIEMKAIEARLSAAPHRTAVGSLWRGLETDFDRIDEVLAWGGNTRSVLSACVRDTASLLATRGHLKMLLGEGKDLLREGGSVHASMTAFCLALKACMSKLNAIGEISGTDAAALVDGKHPGWLDQMSDRLRDWKAATRELRDWCSWRRACHEASQLGLRPLIEAITQNLVAPGEVRWVFEANYARWWTVRAVDATPLLRSFVAATHEGQIARFRELDEKLKTMAASLVRARLAGRIPSADARQHDPEYKVLTREMAKRARHMPVRQLAEKMPTALRKLTPCLMMSPLSVAQYLPAGAEPFDLIIFDEASQIPTWDAVGAIGRGRQVIVVGDPKQLPPTDFFARGNAPSDEDPPDEMTDLESILDECLGAGIPGITLSWHYRSRHESLIAFSNQAYYGGGLVTFPSPVTDDRAVSFRFVPDGIYEPGKAGSHTNPAEARAVVAEAARIMRDGSGRSLGIVTFNAEQQKRIADALEAEMRKDQALERTYGEKAPEPLLVKNLENIQGEERDVMLFSLTYGPDRGGRLSVNFGPLNRDGGERRLNVAITRARDQLIVFGSQRGDHIDIKRTQALGVHDLRKFLTFAEHGATALAGLHEGSVGGFDSVFEAEVADLLRAKGWQVVTQIGISGFRIDLGIVDPDRPSAFLAGVECDGATYHRSATARDRDRLRQAVLENLGWCIIRIWSTDWWTNAPREAARVDQALGALLAGVREERAQQEEQDREATRAALKIVGVPAEVEPTFEEETIGEAPARADRGLDAEEVRATAEIIASPKVIAPEPMVGKAEEHWLVAEEHILIGKAPLLENVTAQPPEQPTQPSPRPSPVQARFFDLDYLPTLRAIILHTIRQTGPLREDVLVQSVSRLHGFGRAGKDIRERILRAVPSDVPRSEEEVGVFVWPEGMSPQEPLPFKPPSPGEDIDPSALPLARLVSLARTCLPGGVGDEEIVIAMRNACGMSRMGAANRARFEAALTQARAT